MPGAVGPGVALERMGEFADTARDVGPGGGIGAVLALEIAADEDPYACGFLADGDEELNLVAVGFEAAGGSDCGVEDSLGLSGEVENLGGGALAVRCGQIPPGAEHLGGRGRGLERLGEPAPNARIVGVGLVFEHPEVAVGKGLPRWNNSASSSRCAPPASRRAA